MSVGTTYGKYFLLKKLAAGGMGEVFLARQSGPAGFEKTLVIKRILSHLSENEDYARLFLSEAKIQAQMNHSSIVQIFDLGQSEDDGTFYMAMEFVHGKALVDLEAKAKKIKELVPPALTAQILERAADALSYAHNMTDSKGQSMGIIHRDVSPHNILISYRGDVKLIDFGIAKSEMSVVKTETGTIKGKFYYMSPEQSAAMPLDKRSDIFSLGIVLYEALVGENPFQKPNVVLSLEAIQKYDPPPPSQVNPELAPFDPIIAKSLAKDREQRYSDAEEMKEDLARVRAQLPPPAERLGPYVSRLFKESLDQDTKAMLDTDGANINKLETPTESRAGGVRRPVKSPVATPQGKGLSPASRGSTPASQGVSPASKGLSPASKRPSRQLQAIAQPAENAGIEDEETLAKPDDVEVSRETVMRSPAHFDSRAAGGNGGLDTHEEADELAQTLVPGQMRGYQDEEPADMGEPVDTAPRLQVEEKSSTTRIAIIAATVLVVGGGGGFIAWALSHSDTAALPPVKKVSTSDTTVTTTSPNPPVDPAAKAAAEKKAAEEAAAKKAQEEAAAKAAEEEKRKADEALKAAQAKEDEAAKRGADDKAKQDERTKQKEAAAESRKREQEEKKAAAEAKKKEKADAAKKNVVAEAETPSGQASGKLILKTIPAVVVSANGKKVTGAGVPLSGSSGTIEVGDDSAPFKVKLKYRDADGNKVVDVTSEPRAMVSVNGTEQGRTPIFGLKIGDYALRVEVKNPDSDKSLTLLMRYSAK
jgi:eukaryotic-like serine/threonine-protein kinase